MSRGRILSDRGDHFLICSNHRSHLLEKRDKTSTSCWSIKALPPLLRAAHPCALSALSPWCGTESPTIQNEVREIPQSPVLHMAARPCLCWGQFPLSQLCTGQSKEPFLKLQMLTNAPPPVAGSACPGPPCWEPEVARMPLIPLADSQLVDWDN